MSQVPMCVSSNSDVNIKVICDKITSITLYRGGWGYSDNFGIFSIQTTIFWINYLSYNHFYKQLYHMKTTLTVISSLIPSPKKTSILT